ncbi:arylsulfatase [bacterium]|nr:arylsulfatase [bacterium]MDB4568291.1 arylsulfatase [Akkermansiaceae bacterium]
MRFFLSLSYLLGASSFLAAQPNIVFLFVDDMGYSDIGCYGGEIETPHIDSLADGGLRLTNFHVTPMCVTSRASLLAGMEYSAAGYANIAKGVSFPHLLRDAGYHTSLAGKSHAISNISTGNPNTDYGFERFFGFRAGATDNFSGDGNWRLDNQDFTSFGADFYATDAITDFAIDFIDQAVSQEKPFFTWVCYNAPHGKLQAPEADVRKYYDGGVYDAGWDQLRKDRLARQKAMGIVPAEMPLADYGVEVPRWDSLPQTSSDLWVLQKDFETLCMSAYAAMMDKVDQNVGRLIAHLDDPDGNLATDDSVLDNTLIIFCSDNGGAYAGQYSDRNALPWDRNSNANFNTNFGWGALQNTPFKSYKHSGYNGGIRSPFVAHWPDGISLPGGTILHQTSNLWDFYPTFLELAGATYPASYAGKTTKPLMGESIVPLFSDASSTAGSEFFISHYDTRSKALLDDGWKAVTYADGPWELYDQVNDPAESRNLVGKHPARLSGLVAQWEAHFVANPPPGAANPSGSVWNLPRGTKHRGWGYDRIMDGLVSSTPEYMSGGVPLDTKLSFNFAGAIDFNGTAGLKIRLQRYGDPAILWEADPVPSDVAQGTTAITFNDFPTLEPDTHYYISWDQGWAKYDDNGTSRVVRTVREAAFAFRFRTVSTYGSRLEDTLQVAPGGTSLLTEDSTGNGNPDFLGYLSGAGLGLEFDDEVLPPRPLLSFSSKQSSGEETLTVEYSPDLESPFTPMFTVSAESQSIQGDLVEEVFGTPTSESTDFILRLKETAFDPSVGFFRIEGAKEGEEPLAIWTFRGESLAPVTLSTLFNSLDAAFSGGNSGVISSAGPFTFSDPLTAWSGAQLQAAAIGTQIQTAVVAAEPMMVTRVTYSGTLWTNRQAGAVTTVSADLVAWLNDALDSPGIVSPRQTIVSTIGGNDAVNFTITYPINGKVLQSGDKWDLRLRLQDGNGGAYALNQEGFGIDTVTIYGEAAP